MVKGHVRRQTLKTIRILISVVKYRARVLSGKDVFVFRANIYRQDLANARTLLVSLSLFPPFFLFRLFQKNEGIGRSAIRSTDI